MLAEAALVNPGFCSQIKSLPPINQNPAGLAGKPGRTGLLEVFFGIGCCAQSGPADAGGWRSAAWKMPEAITIFPIVFNPVAARHPFAPAQ